MLRIITLKVGQPAKVEVHEEGSTLSILQEAVGGLIERVPDQFWAAVPGLDLWCNEEGLNLGLPSQMRSDIRLLSHTICGDMCLTRVDEEGKTISVTDEDISRFCRGYVYFPGKP